METFAEKVCLGITTIASEEKGFTPPTLDTIEKFAKVLEFDIHEKLNFESIDNFNKCS